MSIITGNLFRDGQVVPDKTTWHNLTSKLKIQHRGPRRSAHGPPRLTLTPPAKSLSERGGGKKFKKKVEIFKVAPPAAEENPLYKLKSPH